ncbi:hypothetical protein CsSME_00018522 [Camellia sinensis var. sinensis]
MVLLSCAYSAYLTHTLSLRDQRGFFPVRSTSPVAVSLTHHHHHHHHHHDHPFVPEAMLNPGTLVISQNPKLILCLDAKKMNERIEVGFLSSSDETLNEPCNLI